MANKQAEETTHFGYERVAWEEKEKRVAGVFHSVAAKYDIMNDVMSFGIHRLWKRFTISMSAARSGHQILDIAGGTGDLSAQFSNIVGPEGRIVLADINDSMLKVGRNKLTDRGICGNIEYVQANAEALPFSPNAFDCITIAFGLRNVTDKDKALRSMFNTLKPGGRLLVLEFSKVTNSLVKKLYDTYSMTALPVVGKLIAGDADSYKYLAESIRMHPNQETLKAMMQEAGFIKTSFYNMSSGIVALHKGIKPSA